MLDSPEGVCAGRARFEYPATSVLFSNRPWPGSCLPRDRFVTTWFYATILQFRDRKVDECAQSGYCYRRDYP